MDTELKIEKQFLSPATSFSISKQIARYIRYKQKKRAQKDLKCWQDKLQKMNEGNELPEDRLQNIITNLKKGFYSDPEIISSIAQRFLEEELSLSTLK